MFIDYAPRPNPYILELMSLYRGGTILLTNTTTSRNEVALSYHRVRGLYFLAVVFAATIG